MTRFQNNGAGSHLKQFRADFDVLFLFWGGGGGGLSGDEACAIDFFRLYDSSHKTVKIFCLMSHKIKEGDKTM